MSRFIIVWSLLFFLGTSVVRAQVSPDCGNAVPICSNTPVNGGTTGFGIDDFDGAATSGCLEQTLSGAIESNSAWYRFRTGASGQLGFDIGIDTLEDWDFALYKSNDCNNLGEPIRCNFFDNQDENRFVGVGEDPTGDTENVQYEDWLEVTAGEDYYLMINNFSNNNSGFSIQFSGHIFVTNPYDALDCSIINNLLGPPQSVCEGDIVDLNATTSGATTYNWYVDTGSGFTQIAGEHDAVYRVDASATYRVEVVRPSETIISEVQVYFSERPVTGAVSDDASCSSLSVYDLSQKDVEALGGQSPDDFVVSYHASFPDATNGANALPKQYEVPTGSQTIYVRLTSVGNSKCFDVTEQFELVNLQTPDIDFPSEVFLCQSNTGVVIGPSSPNVNYSYFWSTGETTPNLTVSEAGEYKLTVTHTQSGLSCSRAQNVTVYISRPPQITGIEINDLQNDNTVTVLVDTSDDYEYRLDEGAYQTGNTFYQVSLGMHTVSVNDPKGCGAVSEQIVVVGFPKFFTPNGDGVNDIWGIFGVETLNSPSISIFDRMGKLLAQLEPSNPEWDGYWQGRPLPESDYWFKLTYVDARGQTVTAKYINNHFSLKR
ncbi:T9SS type B sorting domain-containing protein [Zobellia galactanivorans]|uniref:T9SS type B sorting domain-containing protein n=1 Tax=Zobellia galactanivorans (strain DSM 12802 / CCUG 47099 / CIP 106680 / NCIMB 13871 / Dsij) TaxID=63186 RepID=UPI0026E2F7B7|nr:T9SS type B sorting domain-containing protein [Zobellia galactanivorans]MDO6811200.1 T9SS type B sorting domain-containing protein [Zobellia galactanivorans]